MEPTGNPSGFSGILLFPGGKEPTKAPSGFTGVLIGQNRVEFIQKITGFKGVTFSFVPPSNFRIFHLEGRK